MRTTTTFVLLAIAVLGTQDGPAMISIKGPVTVRMGSPADELRRLRRRAWRSSNRSSFPTTRRDNVAFPVARTVS